MKATVASCVNVVCLFISPPAVRADVTPVQEKRHGEQVSVPSCLRGSGRSGQSRTPPTTNQQPRTDYSISPAGGRADIGSSVSNAYSISRSRSISSSVGCGGAGGGG